MRNKEAPAERIQLWVFWRHFWLHRRENLFVLIILTTGFLFYTIYGTWSAATSSAEVVDTEPLEVPADVVAQVPHWVTGLDFQSPAAVFKLEQLRHRIYLYWREAGHRSNHPPVEAPIECIEGVLEVPVLSPGGSVFAWGIGDWSGKTLESFPIRAGRWPSEPGEIAVHTSFAELTGRGAGDDVLLQYAALPGLELRQQRTRVVGLYSGSYDVMPSIMLSDSELQELTGIVAQNVFLAWSKAVPPKTVTTGPPANRTYRFDTPPLEDLVGTGLAPTRMPVMQRFEPVGTYFPFGIELDDRVRINGGVEHGLRPLFEGIAVRIWPLTVMIFLSQGIALTVVLAIVVVDRQKMLGVYKVLGVDVNQLRRVYFYQVLIIGLTATVVGSLGFAALRPLLAGGLGIQLSLQTGAMVMWLSAVLLFALWSAHVAGSLFETTASDSLLKVAFNFDWWSIVRIGVSPVGVVKKR